MSEEKKSFTVKDRRHFTAEGRARDEPAEAEAPAPTAPVPTPPRPPPAAEDRGESQGAVAADFAGFLLTLAAQASLALTGDEGTEPDMAAARHFIGLFEMLKDKTQGRRTPEEDQVIEGILYELRVAFVARARSGGA